jgi:hypothetical protein
MQNDALPNISVIQPGTLTCNQLNITLQGNKTSAGVNFKWIGGPANNTYTVINTGTTH